MSLSIPYIVLLAKQRELEAFKRLKTRVQLVGQVGHMIHALQAERGASSAFLGSCGQWLEDKRGALIDDSRRVEVQLREMIEDQLLNPAFANARIISLMAWVLLGLDALPDLRARISQQSLSGREAVTAYSRLIAGLISLIFEVAEAAVDPRISRLLVGLINLVEGKELAGQERALGALAFAGGECDNSLRQRLAHLIDAQQHSFKVFLEFASADINASWDDLLSSDPTRQQEDLRRLLLQTTKPGDLEPSLAPIWFDCCSEKIGAMWSIQCDLVSALNHCCSTLMTEAEHKLLNSDGLLQSLKASQPARADAVERFFDPDIAVEHALNFDVFAPAYGTPSPTLTPTLTDVLQRQSIHLAEVEAELASAKRALQERKLIERAKGMIMAKYRISEEQAHRQMRSLSMDRNLRLVQVAEDLLKGLARSS